MVSFSSCWLCTLQFMTVENLSAEIDRLQCRHLKPTGHDERNRSIIAINRYNMLGLSGPLKTRILWRPERSPTVCYKSGRDFLDQCYSIKLDTLDTRRVLMSILRYGVLRPAVKPETRDGFARMHGEQRAYSTSHWLKSRSERDLGGSLNPRY